MKINIHFELNKNIKSYIVDINRQLIQNGITGIRFSGGDATIPHLTITLGSLRESATLSDVIATVDRLSRQTKPFWISLGKPYIVPPKNKWVFMDAEPVSKIYAVKKLWCDELSLLLNIDWGGRPENEPHVTLGYSPTATTDNFDLHGFSSINLSLELSHVAIAEMGDYGTCVRELHKVSLG